MISSYLLSSVPVSFPGLGITDISVSREAFRIGSFAIYWYGIFIVVAFAACVILALRQSKKFRFTGDEIIDYALFAIPASLIGARIYYVLSSLNEFSSDWKSIFDTRNGGLAVYGGILFAVLAVFLVAKKKKRAISSVFDFLIVYVPLGQAVGRLGNFTNQEAFGVNTNLPWGMISPETSRYISLFCPGLDPNLPVHPTFLYEAIASCIIFILLLLIRNKAKRPFTTVSAYCIFYGVARFLIEGIRTDSLYIGQTGLRTSQVLSAVLVIVGLLTIVAVRYLDLKRVQNPILEELSEKEEEKLSQYSILLEKEEIEEEVSDEDEDEGFYDDILEEDSSSDFSDDADSDDKKD